MHVITVFRMVTRNQAIAAAVLAVLILSLLCAAVHGDDADAAGQSERIDPTGISGSLVLCGGGALPNSIVETFVELAGGEEGKLVVIPTAASRVDAEDRAKSIELWKSRGIGSVAWLHTRSRDEADDPEFVMPLKEATAVWLSGGSQSRIADAYLDTAVEQELYALLARGGVIGGTSAGAAIQSRLMIASGNPVAKLQQGFDLLPSAVVDQHWLARKRQPRLLKVLEEHPGRVGYGIDEGTALVVQGRRMRVVGDSTVTVCLASSSSQPARQIELAAGERTDLTMLRRAAKARAQPHFPPEKCAPPQVASGALVIVGGGGMPQEVIEQFIELAGGPQALIVVLPTAAPDPIPQQAGQRMFLRAGAKNVKVLRERTLAEVESPTFLETLENAGGVWFGGGRQWRFVDAYEGTKAHEAMRQVLARGGVIGGSSAGASIQAEYLVRGSPLGNREMMAEGYERGLGFLPGAAIDQHFAQRNRFADMTSVVERYPQLLGIGIDEGTALVVRGSTGEVIGKNQVHFYDRNQPVEACQPDYESVPAGGRYDLAERKIVKSTNSR